MSLSRALAEVLARDARYTIEAYAFLFEALEYTRAQLRRGRARFRAARVPPHPASHHVSGQQLCEGARRLALEQYGQLAPMILASWGLHSTSNLGDLVYNLIATGAMEKTAADRRSDFDDVFDFDTAFRPEFVLDGDPVV
jgi:uncharacterized repeat protein (TIGR04138 family)